VSALREGQEYQLFKQGIKPDWSDTRNSRGGRLIYNMKKDGQEKLETAWMEVLLVLIGEQAGEFAYQVNGAALSVKKREDRLAVWLKVAEDLAGVTRVGRLVKSQLGLGPSQLFFQAHGAGGPVGGRRGGSRDSPAKLFI
jgi:translation initiation factor 4E